MYLILASALLRHIVNPIDDVRNNALMRNSTWRLRTGPAATAIFKP